VQDISERHKIDQMNRDFVSIFSHELRTPLTSMRGALGILETGVLNNRPEKAQHMMSVAIQNSDRLIRLVNDILDLERLESGQVTLVKEPCHIGKLMEAAVESLETIAVNANITLNVAPLDLVVPLSPDAILQTLTNLLSNAIKFSATGDTVWLTAELIEEKNQSKDMGEETENPLTIIEYQASGTQHKLPPSPQNPKSKIQNPKPTTLLDTSPIPPPPHPPISPPPSPPSSSPSKTRGEAFPPTNLA
jgi:signal transduction histidine kinase